LAGAVIDSKDPVKVRAGRIGAVKRWGTEPVAIRLDDLTPPQKRLVLALVAAAKQEASEPPGSGQS
jgi:hypothetical protein